MPFFCGVGSEGRGERFVQGVGLPCGVVAVRLWTDGDGSVGEAGEVAGQLLACREPARQDANTCGAPRLTL